MVVVVGIDVHKDTHCVVAVDQAGRQVGSHLTVRATDAGHRQLLRWAARDDFEKLDGSTQEPVLNVADFGCFLQSFAAGCR